MGDEVCEIEEIIEEEASMATLQDPRKVNYNSPDFSNGGPHISIADISFSPTLAQNGGDKTDEQQRQHRKNKEGSGGLPLYIFLQESVASEGGRKVDPRCPNSSNPYHMCTDSCLTKMSDTRRDDAPKSPFSFLSRHSRTSSSDGSFRDGSKVDTRCPNSSNPYHECTDNCRSKFRQTDIENGTKSTFPFMSHSAPTTSENSRDARKVDARCPNYANPYHECTDNCRPKFSQSDKADKQKSSFRLFSNSSRTSSGASSGRLGDNRKVDPRCLNAPNPYHECNNDCFRKLQGSNHAVPTTPDSSTSREGKGSKGSVQSVERRDGVHPECVNASNPYHKCSNHCFEKMQR